MTGVSQEVLSVLIVEDEPLISMMLEDFVDGLGHRVAGAADSVGDAISAIEATDFDIAILDVRLRGGEPCWPVVEAVRLKGKRFVLATGGHVETPPEQYRGCRTISKPYTMDSIRDALETECAGG